MDPLHLTPAELAAMLPPGTELLPVPTDKRDRPVVMRVVADCPTCGRHWHQAGTWLGTHEAVIRLVAEPFHEPPGAPADKACNGPVSFAVELRPREARGQGPSYRGTVSWAGDADRTAHRMLERVQQHLARELEPATT